MTPGPSGQGAFDPGYEDLPSSLRVFPLSGALLLPGGRLPLNIFEPRYLNMVNDSIAGDRLIGMIQTLEEGESAAGPMGAGIAGQPEIYQTGCVGRIISFSETEDGRYLITLGGLIRFDVVSELAEKDGFRQVQPSYTRFRADLDEPEAEAEGEIDRAGLLEALRGYFDCRGIQGDWDAIEETPDGHLVTSLAMICPFAPSEKQALLEAMTLPERAETMTTILQMAAHGAPDAPARH